MINGVISALLPHAGVIQWSNASDAQESFLTLVKSELINPYLAEIRRFF